MDTVLQGLFQAFSIRCVQLRKAVKLGEDELVRLVDRGLEPIIDDILSYEAKTPEEVREQLQFVATLIRDEADDKSAVVRRAAAMSALINRYSNGVDGGRSAAWSASKSMQDHGASPGVQDHALLNEAILDSLPDRVGVVTRDYRYLYSNQQNARAINKNPLSMIGCHVSEFIGEESFRVQAKPAYDRCFAGEVMDYVHHGVRNGKAFSTRCRMTPLHASNKTIIGAIIVLQNIDETVALEHS